MRVLTITVRLAEATVTRLYHRGRRQCTHFEGLSGGDSLGSLAQCVRAVSAKEKMRKERKKKLSGRRVNSPPLSSQWRVGHCTPTWLDFVNSYYLLL